MRVGEEEGGGGDGHTTGSNKCIAYVSNLFTGNAVQKIIDIWIKCGNSIFLPRRSAKYPLVISLTLRKKNIKQFIS